MANARVGRVGAILLSSYLVPAIAAFMVFGVFQGHLLSGVAVGLYFAPMLLTPYLLGIWFLGLIFAWNKRRIHLGPVVLSTMVATGIFLVQHSKGYMREMLAGLEPVILILMSGAAALCWHITKKWHSPEPTP